MSTEKKSKSPLAKLFKGKSKGFTVTAEATGMNYKLHFLVKILKIHQGNSVST